MSTNTVPLSGIVDDSLTIDLSDTSNTITINSPWSTMASGITYAPSATNSILTSSIGSSSWSDLNNSVMQVSNQKGSGVIEIQGEKADIVVNGESLMDTLRGIQDRLNMLKPNPELEAEWDQLRELGEQYRKLEKEFAEKAKMWQTLKKT